MQALHDWGDRVRHVHLKDVARAVIARARDWQDAWRNGAFCELGTGDVDLEGVLSALGTYDGWIVVEQDWFPRAGEDPAEHLAAQQRNRGWLHDHGV